MNDDKGKKLEPVAKRELLQRSDVPPGKKYRDYVEYLRPDFFFCCAYCTMSEAEAQAIRFTIDHYEPQKTRPDLVNEYSNLMYCCDMCNVYKGDRVPTDEMRKKGMRYFRPDQDFYDDHFKKKDLRLDHKTNVGEYTIEAIDLNRPALRRLRELRERATKCDGYVLGGLLALRNFPIDRLPEHLKGRAAIARREADRVATDIIDAVDTLLKENGRSPLIDEDEDKKIRARERAAKLKYMEGLRPGSLKATKR